MVQAAPSSATATATAAPVPDADPATPPSRLLSKHRPRRRAAPPRPTLPHPAPTRGLPDLNRCHCCSVRFQQPAPGAKRRPLRPLRSLWRVVLLCSECISLLRSGAVCSYCLNLDNLPHDDSVTCRSCNCCVHHHCIPAEHRTALIQPVDLENFVCVDCCPTVKVGSKNEGAESVPKLELVIREPSPAVRRKGGPVAAAKLNSPRKVVEEVRPAWKDAMALVPVGEGSESKGPGDRDLPDEALALQLHLAINGSPRISRSGSASVSVLAGQGKRQGKRQNGLVYGRKVNEDLGLCVTNMMDHLDYLETGAEMGSNWNASQDLGSDPTVPVVLALECKGKRPQESPRGERKGLPETKQHNSLVDWHKVDRYEKKYSKRKSSKQTDAESTGNKTLPNGKDMDVGEGGEGITPMT
ncbi:hypothetical protein CFC21_108773 [Triticum aestivum]|uniref:Uncharacterized protein n=1 Tax=Triticum aestivum TaxID=4565 RepID=A0A9R1MJ41_WHEAT|nr:hypothetical protein CFC21_108773 [Triticum aestivum]